jgi:hypothetical protein
MSNPFLCRLEISIAFTKGRHDCFPASSFDRESLQMMGLEATGSVITDIDQNSQNLQQFKHHRSSASPP